MARQFTTKRREFLRWSAMAGAGAVIAACAPSTTQAGRASPTTDTSRLVVAVQSLGAQNFAPWLSNDPVELVVHLIGDTLVHANPKTLALEGGLAESWSLSADLTTWDFKLRPNIPFHDGYGTVTADDVKFSWGQFIQATSVQGEKPLLLQAIDGDITNFEVVGPLEFKLHTTHPVVYLAAELSNVQPSIAIQSQKYWQTNPAQALVHPIGTGPFKFVSSTPGVGVELQAVQNHWRQTSTFKAVSIQIIADDAARLAAAESGSVDIAAITPMLDAEATSAGLRLISLPNTGSVQLVFGGQYPADAVHYDRNAPWIQADNPTKGLAIRQAMQYAVDSKTILNKVMGGVGTLVHAPFVEYPADPQLVDPSWTLPAYDVAKAKQLLAQGGYPNGFPVTVPIYEQNNRAGTSNMAEAVAGMFEAIGLKVTRLPTDGLTVLTKTRARQTAGWAFINVAPFDAEAAQELDSICTPDGAAARVWDPVATAAIPQLKKEPDQAKRYAIVRTVLSAMIKSVPVIPMFTYDQPYAVGKKIAGWSPVGGLAEVNALETVTAK